MGRSMGMETKSIIEAGENQRKLSQVWEHIMGKRSTLWSQR